MGRVALVTGAGSGIGEATARTLAAVGWHVVACDRNAAGAEKTASAIRGSGGSAEDVELDITNIPATQAAARELLAQHRLIEAVVANAGISGDGVAFEAVTEQAYDAMMAVNVKGHFFLLQALVPAMKQEGRGSIVLMSSMFALIGHTSMAHYTAAKGGLLALSKALAAELGPAGIRVNAVAPGLIRTPMTEKNTGNDEAVFVGRAARIPLRRLATMQDVADTVGYLVSPAAAAITGQTLSPSGGEAFTD
jgi:3-oxoacyl-[acyl-carrier protein] reductase